MSGRAAALLAVLVVTAVAIAAATVVLLPDRAVGPDLGGPATTSPTSDASDTTPPQQTTRTGAILNPCRRGDAERLTVLSLNIHSGRTKAGELDLGRIAAELRAWDADLVLLQEVDQGRRRTHGVDQSRSLARRLGYSHVYGPTRRFRPGSTGNAILSRWPVVDVGLRALPRESGAYRRGLVRATVDVRGERIDVFSTHFDHASPRARLAQARAVVGTLQRSSRPVVLGGDLNAEPGMPAVRVLERGGLLDGWRFVGRDEGLTVPAASPRRRIDYVLADESFEPVRSRVLVSFVSDHRAVITAYDLLPPRCR